MFAHVKFLRWRCLLLCRPRSPSEYLCAGRKHGEDVFYHARRMRIYRCTMNLYLDAGKESAGEKAAQHSIMRLHPVIRKALLTAC